MVDPKSSGPAARSDAAAASGASNHGVPQASVPTSGASEPEGLAVDLCQLVTEHYQDVYRYAYRLSGRPADAEDLTQQTFLVAQAKLHQLRDATRVGSWLYAVLRSCFLKAIRRPQPQLMDPQEMAVEDSVEAQRELLAIDSEELQVALNELPDEHRLIVLMFYLDELSYREISEQLGIPMGTVMSRLARAKGRLRDRLVGESTWRKSSAAKARVRVT